MHVTTCKRCERVWPDNSEQAACVRVYNQCIICCVEMEKTENYQWGLDVVVENRREFISR